MKKIFLIYLVNLIMPLCYSQHSENEMWQIVLNKNIPDSTFIFNQTKKDIYNETQLTYLGLISTNDNKNFKLLKSCWLWGLSKRATGRIIIFNRDNQYVGEYYVGGLYDLPEKLVDNSLIFTNAKNNDCDSKLKTVISFKKGIPEKIFIRCKNENGNIYTFSSE